ncbi:MAG: ATP-binding cassette domain-containing protein [Mariprofundaceae bacterium]
MPQESDASTLTVYFPSHQLQICRGESLLLSGGKSGCGKSYFLHCLAGLSPWLQGVHATSSGQEWPPKKHDARAVRMLFDLWPLPWLGHDVAEELMFGLPCQPDQGAMKEALAAWRMGGLDLHTPTQSLSRMQAVCVTLAAASLAEPKLLLLDNPVASLPLTDADWLRDTIRGWAKDSGCMVVSACSRWQEWNVDRLWWVEDDHGWPTLKKNMDVS